MFSSNLWIQTTRLSNKADSCEVLGLGAAGITQRTRDIEPMLVFCCPIVYDAGTTLNQHCLNVSCLLGRDSIVLANGRLIYFIHWCPRGVSRLRRIYDVLNVTAVLRFSTHPHYIGVVRPALTTSNVVLMSCWRQYNIEHMRVRCFMFLLLLHITETYCHISSPRS